MSKIFCMASAKGGSGKTVLTSTFATFLTSLNKKVLIIDTDASTNGLTLMYLKEVMIQKEVANTAKRIPRGAFEISLDSNEAVFSQPELVSLPCKVDFLPATYSFINTEIVNIQDFIKNLEYLTIKYSPDYDFIFLDAQAGSDSFAQACMKGNISDEVIIVSEYDPLSAAGVERLKALFRDDLTYNRIWILLNKMLPEFVQSFNDFLEIAKYLSPIPWDAAVVKAYARRKLAIDLEYGNEFTLSIMQTLKSLLGDSIIPELDSWAAQRATSIREPLDEQIKDLEKRLEVLLKSTVEAVTDVVKTSLKKRLVWFLLPIFLMILLLLLPNEQRDASISLYNIKFSVTTFIGVLIGLALIFSIITYGRSKFEKEDFKSIEDMRLEREIHFLQERISKLDALKNADIDVLIKIETRFE